MKQKKRASCLHFSDKDLEAIYDSGKNATINFMRMLIDKINQLGAQIVKLEDEKSKDSHNSNKPPSLDNHNKKPKSLRKKTGRKPGGQKNHKGYTLKKVEKPDKVEKIPSNKKCDCGKSLKFAKVRKIYRIDAKRFKENFNFFVDKLAMKDFINKPVRTLSLGQKMRAEIASVLLHDPDILYLDEPTIGLDVMAKSWVREFLRDINKKKKITVILTTHDMDDDNCFEFSGIYEEKTGW